MSGWATLDGYVVVRTTDKAVGLAKSSDVIDRRTELTWIPRGWCQDGDMLKEGDTDVTMFESQAEAKGLDF